MKQEKLKEKALELFRQQDFKIKQEEETFFQALNEDTELELRVLSSEDFSMKEASEKIGDGEKVFVDKGLEEIKNKVENDVSILEDHKEKDVEIPSYERIGDIVVISELEGISEEEAVEGVLEHNPSLDSILLKEENLSGEFRVGGYRKLYGDETETVHREHGVKLKVDPTKMFFSEREGTERKRIFESVEADEKVLVMFAGVGPFPVTIAKHSEASVTGVEKNPEAVAFAKENIRMNNVEDRVEMIQGDVREICPDLGKFDHVLMPSPTNALDFIGEGLSCVKDNGRLVVYSVSDREDLYGSVIEKVEDEASSLGLGVEVIERRLTADFSPSKRKVAVEFRIDKE